MINFPISNTSFTSSSPSLDVPTNLVSKTIQSFPVPTGPLIYVHSVTSLLMTLVQGLVQPPSPGTLAIVAGAASTVAATLASLSSNLLSANQANGVASTTCQSATSSTLANAASSIAVAAATVAATATGMIGNSRKVSSSGGVATPSSGLNMTSGAVAAVTSQIQGITTETVVGAVVPGTSGDAGQLTKEEKLVISSYTAALRNAQYLLTGIFKKYIA
ncbi:unnamed protein product [Protopolystoma xenopodis]|uniref:Uncharacterized protein n=1 Tax=Protopolystoma xenopodis TaxID=117903 RepID=A0A3S5A0X5_9PLAT|nr:unnamed protein product [Protopolystoma xenopodis]